MNSQYASLDSGVSVPFTTDESNLLCEVVEQWKQGAIRNRTNLNWDSVYILYKQGALKLSAKKVKVYNRTKEKIKARYKEISKKK